MTRRWRMALGLLACLAATAAAQQPPTKQQTMDYLVRKVGAEPEVHSAFELLGHRSDISKRTTVRFEAPPDEGDRVVVTLVSIVRAEDSPDPASDFGEVDTWNGLLSRLDPERVRVTRATDQEIAAARDNKPFYIVRLDAAGDARAFRKSVLSGGMKNLQDLIGEDLSAFSGLTPFLGAENDGPTDNTVSLIFTDEAAAHAAAKAFIHLIRACGGKPAPPADPATAFFEGDAPAAATAATPAPAPAPTPTPEPIPPTTPGPSRAEQRRQLQKEIIDAEATLPAAMRQDAANQRWNEQREATFRQRLQEMEAMVQSARQNGETIKSLALEAATLPLKAELDRGEHRRDTGSAERIRQRIAEMRKRLIDLGD